MEGGTMLGEIITENYKIALYIRLSKEDVDRGYDESESITNQRNLLLEYVKKLGPKYQIVDMYIDPGYTGTNFNRPDFKRMIGDIQCGKVNMVITKDLSRLGRDYIETGEYVEKWFPENNVRYVSVTDGIDTFAENNGNNDIAPFKAILNDMYSKDLSKKIKTALHTMQAQGKWVGGKTAMGYMKDPNDKNKLILCKEEADIVKLIFKMAYEGKSAGAIRNYLNEHHIPTAHQSRYNEATDWSSRTIKRILVNPIYTGTTVQNRNSRISYKNRKLRPNPKEQWFVVENTHEAIVDKKIFNEIQKMEIAKKNYFLLDGLMICHECQHKIGVKKDRKTWGMICSYYRRFSKLKVCTAHGFNYCNFEEMILEYLRKLFQYIDENKVALNIKQDNNKVDYTKMQERIKNDISVIKGNLEKMYIDRLNEKINDEMYENVSKKFKEDIKAKEEEYLELEELKNDSFNEKEEIKDIPEIIKQFMELEKPTPELMKKLINRIEVSQDKKVDIVFNFKKLNDIDIHDTLFWT